MLELWRWPVKSMAGEEVRSFRLDERGVGGDRTHAVIHHHKGEWKPLTAREAPRLLAWHAAYPFAPDAGLRPDDPPHAQVTGPDGRSWRWGDPRLRNALAEDLGRDVQLRRDLAGIQDLERSVLVTTEATRAALGGGARPRRSTCAGSARTSTSSWTPSRGPSTAGRAGRCDWRAASCCGCCTPACAARSPRATPSRRPSGPSCCATSTPATRRCFGINARVVHGGRIAVGEAAATEPPASRR